MMPHHDGLYETLHLLSALRRQVIGLRQRLNLLRVEDIHEAGTGSRPGFTAIWEDTNGLLSASAAEITISICAKPSRNLETLPQRQSFM
jgi:hypothetical protein